MDFALPQTDETPSVHHTQAAQGNSATTDAAIAELMAVLDGDSDNVRLLLRAAAGAGKSHALKRMVVAAVGHARVERVGIVAFTNKQLYPLARDLGGALGADQVCLYVGRNRLGEVDALTRASCTAVNSRNDIPHTARVILITSHMAMTGSGIRDTIGAVGEGHLFDVVFVDEAWQLAMHLYKPVSFTAPITVGVGDVGQLPPLDHANNPYRGDTTYNPFRAWPTVYEDDPNTWVRELPAVWRPTAAQLPLWRAFYPDWQSLNCVAGPDDRTIHTGAVAGTSGAIWDQVATGTPTLVEVDGLPTADAPDVDPPLLFAVEQWIDELLAAGPELERRRYDDAGAPTGHSERVPFGSDHEETMIALLATRNQAVDDASAIAERLTKKHQLPPGALVASTVDSWQGQTNALTIAIHPLSGASELDEFNSAFGRLAVTCTRATHGLLMVARPGLDDVLDDAPARPGTPFGEPGPRSLPRQTHRRILQTFARGRMEHES